METKRQRQLVNRAKGLSGSIMPIERAMSISRKTGKTVEEIRLADQLTKKKLK